MVSRQVDEAVKVVVEISVENRAVVEVFSGAAVVVASVDSIAVEVEVGEMKVVVEVAEAFSAAVVSNVVVLVEVFSEADLVVEMKVLEAVASEEDMEEAVSDVAVSMIIGLPHPPQHH